ncbi:MAG: FtsW/RodA/SpoVE family cell cycle protein, partial [Sandarakinorhabdus sp.]|nr:FtsW/RodA/SpoVE family cell cycle protein [Sandarakinorhabdus sp.]
MTDRTSTGLASPWPGDRGAARASAAFSRGDHSRLGQWFWTIDKLLLTFVIVLIGCGIIAVAAASPAAAQRLSGANFKYGDLYFLKRQILWVIAGVPVMLGVSMLPIVWAKRLSIIGTVVLLVCLMLVPFFGAGANGAQRWL